MNRNEELRNAMLKQAFCAWLNGVSPNDLDETDMRSAERVFGRIIDAALTALESIMEKEGLKALSKAQFYELLGAHNKMRRDEGATQYCVFEDAECEMRGGV